MAERGEVCCSTALKSNTRKQSPQKNCMLQGIFRKVYKNEGKTDLLAFACTTNYRNQLEF